MPEKLQFSSIVERSLAILGRNLTGAAFVSVLLVGLPSVWLSAQLPMPGQPPASLAGFILALYVLLVGQNVLAGMMLYPAFRHQLGLAPPSLGLLFSYGATLAFQALGVALTLSAAVGFGMLMFLLPGLIFALVFFVAMPAAIVERLPVADALRRSVQLTEGHRWTILGYMVILWLASLLIGWTAGLIFSLVGLAEVASVIISSLIYAFSAIVTSIVYHDLRRLKEGATAEDMVRTLMEGADRPA